MLFGGEGAGDSCDAPKFSIIKFLGIRTELSLGIFLAKLTGGEGTAEDFLLISGEPHICIKSRNVLDRGDIN